MTLLEQLKDINKELNETDLKTIIVDKVLKGDESAYDINRYKLCDLLPEIIQTLERQEAEIADNVFKLHEMNNLVSLLEASNKMMSEKFISQDKEITRKDKLLEEAKDLVEFYKDRKEDDKKEGVMFASARIRECDKFLDALEEERKNEKEETN